MSKPSRVIRVASVILAVHITGCGATHHGEPTGLDHGPSQCPDVAGARHLPAPDSPDLGWTWEIPVPNEFVLDLVGPDELERCREAFAGDAVSCSLSLAPGKPLTLVVWGSGRPTSIMISKGVLGHGVDEAETSVDWRFTTREDAAKVLGTSDPADVEGGGD